LGLPGALKAAEQDRGQDRQHLLQDLGADPGEDRRLARDRAAHVLGAEQCLERLVALRHGSLGEGEGRVVEERGITARAHQPERARERVRLAGASLQAKREGGEQRLHRPLDLIRGQAELARHGVDRRAPLDAAHDVEQIEHRGSSLFSWPRPTFGQGQRRLRSRQRKTALRLA
jgi:hypothetical protein